MERSYTLAVAEFDPLKIAEEREQIEYKMALEKVNRLTLKSSINGIINELFLDEGENCQAGQPMVHVVDKIRCLHICNIEASYGKNLKVGQSVDVLIEVSSYLCYADKD
jgi:multidrug resistance efflux pump